MNYLIVGVCFLFSIQTAFGATDFEVFVDPVDLIKERGYPAENYTVQTDDGYLLALYRIPHGKDGTETNKKVVLLNHGLGSSAGDYLNMNSKRSLGYVLADAGYDVWLMNARGNSYSNKHISIEESDKGAFYNFSWHQIGYYDIPANIDFILETTKQEKLQYVGHSQGGTSFLVMASTRKEYNDKIELATLLAPAAFMNHVDPLLKLATLFYDYLVQIPEMFNIYDVPMVELARAGLQIICKDQTNREQCLNIYDIVGGYANHEQVDDEVFMGLPRTFPSNFAVKQPLHYAQSIKTGKFSQYDFGDKNHEVYNSDTPPEYDLGSITCPVSLFAGKNDHLAAPEDATTLSKKLKNLVNIKIIEDANGRWNHADFLFAVDIAKYQYTDMLKIMDNIN